MRGSGWRVFRALLLAGSVALLALVLVTGCSKPATTGATGGSDDASKGSNDTVVVTEASADMTVAATKGQTLLVVLEANPTTGYTWTVASAPEFLKSEGEPTFESEGASGVAGAGGKQTLKFSVTAAGKGTLNLAYLRPWETGVAPAKTFKVDIDAK
jgi:inhibitor of cysteine peptidase